MTGYRLVMSLLLQNRSYRDIEVIGGAYIARSPVTRAKLMSPLAR